MDNLQEISGLLENPRRLIHRISDRLNNCPSAAADPEPPGLDRSGILPSCVMLLLGPHTVANGGPPDPCLILNKRSQRVRQPGDLCCPGGGITPVVLRPVYD